MGWARMDAAMARGSVTRDGPGLYLNWLGGAVSEGLISPFARDTFTRVAASGWGTADSGQAWTVSGGSASDYSVDGSVGHIAVNALATYHLAYINPTLFSTLDFDITVKVSAVELLVGGAARPFIMGRFIDTSNYLRFRIDLNVDTNMGWGIDSHVAGVTTTLTSGLVIGLNYAVNTWFYIRAQGQGSTVRLKSWKVGDAEPDLWTGQATTTAFSGISGGVGLGAYLFNTVTNTLPFVVAYEDFIVGASSLYDVGEVTTGLSLDDGMPNEVTNTNALGVSETTAELFGPVGIDAGAYFSPFRTDQQWSQFPRDVASVVLSSGLVTDDGVRTARLFTGQMADIPVDGKQAHLQAVSRARVRLSTAIQPPAIHAYYEGCEGTWPISYALFKSGINVAPPLLPGTRLYLPLHGSCKTFVPDTNPFDGFQFGYTTRTPITSGIFQRPVFVDGPFVAGLFGEANGVNMARLASRTLTMAPGADVLSQTASKGRIEFWVRGDPVNYTGNTEVVTSLTIVYLVNSDTTRYIIAGLRANRVPALTIRDGTNSLSIDTPPIPTDGAWHFVGMGWDIANNSMTIRLDDYVASYLAAPLVTSALAVTDDISLNLMYSWLPISEIRITSGTWSSPAWGPWANKVNWTPGAILRRSNLNFDGLAEKAPREAFEFMASLARSELARTGVSRDDLYMYLTPGYFTEDQQQTVREVLSTSDNVGQDFKPSRDVHKVYNQVTVNFNESQVQEFFSQVYASSQLVQIPPAGASFLTVPLSAPTVEIRGKAIAVMSGAALAATPPSDTNAVNFITVNFTQDGTGTNATNLHVDATVDSWTPGTATIRLINYTGSNLFIANNVNLPALGLAGKVLAQTQASFLAENLDSIKVRGTRAVTVDMPEIQKREDAQSIAQELASRLSRPRTTFTASVFADVRREPGWLVEVEDTDNTNVSGTFRLSGVSTRQNGAAVEQVVSAETALPVMVWGVGVWGESLWGGG
jgi:hypothetical protein